MQFGHNTNQIHSLTQDADRIVDLRVWMVRNSVSYRMIGEAIGDITANGLVKLLRQSRIPCARHAQLLAFGIPAHLLPPALDVRTGPKPREKKQEQPVQAAG